MAASRPIRPSGAPRADIERVRAIVAGAEAPRPEAWAALLGDKEVLFSASGASLLAVGRKGRTWIAQGAPTGLAVEAHGLIADARDAARAAGAKLSFYGVGPDFAPLAAEFDLSLHKIGERALAPLSSFSLDGKARQVLRTHRNRHLKLGARVDVFAPGAADRPAAAALKMVSDEWLAGHGGLEKGFGLGRFEEGYLAELPLATVRIAGRVVAFASLWPTADRSRVAVDLMRFADDAPNGVMDYLFAELMLWAKAEGYAVFDLNTAPLAGVGFDPRAPLASAAARLIYEKGEALYNFQGVRRFKQKFDPEWEDVFVALAPGAAIMAVMSAAASLTTGGITRTVVRRLGGGLRPGAGRGPRRDQALVARAPG